MPKVEYRQLQSPPHFKHWLEPWCVNSIYTLSCPVKQDIRAVSWLSWPLMQLCHFQWAEVGLSTEITITLIWLFFVPSWFLIVFASVPLQSLFWANYWKYPHMHIFQINDMHGLRAKHQTGNSSLHCSNDQTSKLGTQAFIVKRTYSGDKML